MDRMKRRMSLFLARRKKLQELENDRIDQNRLIAENHFQKQELEAIIRTHERAEFARNEQARRVREAQELETRKAQMIERQQMERKQAQACREAEAREIEVQRVQMIERQQEMQRQAQEQRQRQERLRRASPQSLRRLRGLIRQRYERDIVVWNRRSVLRADRDLVMIEGRKADLILAEIREIVESWTEADGWTPEEWRMAKKIKECLAHGDQRMWEEHPPWE